MPCLSPNSILNPRYKKFDKITFFKYCRDVIGLENCIAIESFPIVRKLGDNFVNDFGYKLVPPDFYLQIPCGTCLYCLKRKRSEWSLRLIYEILSHTESTFVTLTFDDFYLEKFKDDYKKPIKLYIDRLRKKIGFRPRYFFISEYGEDDRYTRRFHFHGIIFGTSREILSYSVQRSLWKYGIADTGYVDFRTANYLTKYMLKMQNNEKPILMCSNGIGASFLNNSNVTLKYLNNYDPINVVYFYGRYYPLPSYYKRKMFDDDMKVDILIKRMNSEFKYEQQFLGNTYLNPREYVNVRNDYYRSTLARGTSKQKPLKEVISILPNYSFDVKTFKTILF